MIAMADDRFSAAGCCHWPDRVG